mmetsp:Transcript_2998/g.4430  ORF Transcript_2998/g.4430 Transcript_2998/m.4430 type:complete len:93 (+) Transcript_2998:870-1148(+)
MDETKRQLQVSEMLDSKSNYAKLLATAAAFLQDVSKLVPRNTKTPFNPFINSHYEMLVFKRGDAPLSWTSFRQFFRVKHGLKLLKSYGLKNA